MSAVAMDRPVAAEVSPPPRRHRTRWTRLILPAFTIGMIVYLASPVLVMIMYSFNELRGERQVARFTCCTLDWWRNWNAVGALNEAALLSLRVALLNAIAATALGTLIGLVLGRYSFRGRAPVNFVIFLAIAIPEIVLASGLLSMFVQVNTSNPLGLTATLGFPTILFSHIGFSIAFVAITVRARVQGLDQALESAAQDLFATPPVAFLRVTLPLILPGVLAGFLLAFVLSLDDFVITNFVKGQSSTLPTWVFGATRIGMPPQVNVWGTMFFTIGIVAASANLIGSYRKRRNA